MNDYEKVAEILSEWLERRNQGDAMKPEELLKAHPELAKKLSPQLRALQTLDPDLPETSRLPERPLETIGEYRIIREIGRGGMGIVYEAEQPSMSRKVALKLLAPVFTESTQAVKRFQREAKAAGSLHHTNIVQAHTMGQHEGYWYYTMELVEGGSLIQLIEEHRKAKLNGSNVRSYFLRVAEMIAGVADALDAAHEAGIIHRDIKPGNLLLDADQKTLKIVDFGMARLDEAPSLTMTGEVLGTPIYMSPEQAKAKSSDINHRTDIYSLGATLYEALTLRPPFKGKSTLAIRSQIVSRDPPLPSQVDRRIPRDLAVICTKAMEKDRKDRYQTAREMDRDLTRFIEGVPILARPIGFVGRSLRKIKRHKVRSILLAATILLAMAAISFAISTSYVTRQNRILEYNQYLAWAQQKFPYSYASGVASMFDLHDLPDNRAHEFFGKAIERLPEKPDAYWLRALAPGCTMKERMDDLDLAVDCGLPESTAKLLRAFLESLRTGRLLTPESKEIYDDASLIHHESAIDFFAKAVIRRICGDHKEALNMLDYAIDTTESASTVHFLARRQRAELRLESGNAAGALEDLFSISALGENSPETALSIAICWNRMDRKDKGRVSFEETMQRLRALDSSVRWESTCRICAWHDELTLLDLISREAIGLYPDDPGILWARASAFVNNDKLDEALVLADHILAQHPDAHHSAYITRYDIFLNKGDIESALIAVDRAIQTGPNCRCAYNSKGELLCVHYDRYEEAVPLFEKAIELCPAWTRALMNLGSALSKLNTRPDEALACLARAEQLTAPGALGDLNRIARERAVILRQQGNFEDALSALTKAIEFDDRDAIAYKIRGALLCDVFSNYQDAVADFERAIEYSSDPSESLRNKGRALWMLGQYDQALAAYDEAIEQKPDHFNTLYDRAVLLSTKLNRPSEALRDFKRVLRIDPTNLYVLDCRAQIRCAHIILYTLRESEEALMAIEQAMNYHSENPEIISLRGLILTSLGRFSEARVDIEKARGWEPPNEMALFYCREALTWYMCDYGEALKAAEEYYEAKGTQSLEDEIVLAYYKVYCLRGLGLKEKAITYADSTILERQLDPFVQPSFYTAYLFAVAGDHKQAEAILESLEEPSDSMNLNNFSRVHAVLGNDERAIELLDRSAELGMAIYPPQPDLGPDFKHLKDDPRYKAILLKIHND